MLPHFECDELTRGEWTTESLTVSSKNGNRSGCCWLFFLLVCWVAEMSETHDNSWSKPRPSNVGIIAMEIYFPSACVNQEELGIARIRHVQTFSVSQKNTMVSAKENTRKVLAKATCLLLGTEKIFAAFV
jgi:hypothetical protein